MCNSSFAKISHLLTFLLLISCVIPNAANEQQNDETFSQCLLNFPEIASNPLLDIIFTRENSSYSSVLNTYIRNLRFHTSTARKPELILTVTHESHIQAAIACSIKHGLEMKVRSGGHDFEGISYVSDRPFFILDMFNFRSISIDIENETAWVQSGATLGELYFKIAEKSSVHGFPAGVCPTVGIGGHLSGGGYGNMMRKYGLTVDNILDAQLIDVNGRVLDRSSMGEDLFWAIRGGGAASFGVVLSYKIRLVRVPDRVTVFLVERTLEQNATDLVHKWLNVAHKLHEDLFIRLTMNVVQSAAKEGEKTIRASFFALFLGNQESLLTLMRKSFEELHLHETDCKEMSWIESILYWSNYPNGTSTDVLLSRASQYPTSFKRKSDYIQNPISKKGLELMWKKMIELEYPFMTFNPYGGKMSEISESATPFPHRAGNICKVQYATDWREEGTEVANRFLNLTRMLYNYMTPFVSKAPREAFLNYRDLDIGSDYGVKYFKGNFKRLVEIKTRVDPQNFFRNEQSIPTFPMLKR